MESELNAFLDSQHYFYISRNNLPTRILKCTVDTSYKPERILGSMYGTLEVPVNVTGLPFGAPFTQHKTLKRTAILL